MKKIEELSLKFSEAIDNVLTNEDSEYYIDIQKEDGTDIMTSLILASALIYNKYTKDECDFLEFTHISNSLVVQFLMNKDK